MSTNEFYSEATQGPIEHFSLGNFELSTGFTLPNADLAYKTHGELNDAHDNAILLLNAYSATAIFMDAFVGPGRPLDPAKYFIVQPSQLGSGLGSSPSTTPPPFDGPSFPAMNVQDDVRAQKQLIDHLGITQLHLVSGYSMGGQQTFEWATRYPDMVARALPIASTATTPDHNRVYLDLIRTLITSDPAFNGGHYPEPHAVHTGLRRHAQATALMGLTARAYRDEAWRSLGFHSRDDFIRGFVEAYFLPMDPNNLLTQMAKWHAYDVGGDRGGADSALAHVTAKTLVVAFAGDLFFPPEDVAADAGRIAGAQFREIGSVWGHFSMYGLDDADTAALDQAYADILDSDD